VKLLIKPSLSSPPSNTPYFPFHYLLCPHSITLPSFPNPNIPLLSPPLPSPLHSSPLIHPGKYGFANNVLAVNATLTYPRQMAFDSSGNAYLAESGNNRIRLITKTTGMISVFAGSGSTGNSNVDVPATGSSALLWYNHGVAVDSSDNVYFTNGFNGVIKRVTRGTTSMTMSTWAGNGTRGYAGDGGSATSARFNWPYGLTIDASGGCGWCCVLWCAVLT
jgi:hypothetical protein